jgi:low affinity Fe/Cu permease
MTEMRMRSWFTRFAEQVARIAGRPATFAVAVALILIWAGHGLVFGFTDTWLLAINTSATIVTFLMVLVIQNTQNRDTAALQIKLDELIRVTKGANRGLLDIEEMDQSELAALEARYEKMATEDLGAPGGGQPRVVKPGRDAS